MKRIITALVLGTGVAFATAVAAADDPIASRQAMMKDVGAAIGALSKMAKGEEPFNAVAAQLGVRVMHAVSHGYGELFPEGTETGGDTEASPKIWEDMAGFKASLAKFQTDTAGVLATPPASQEDVQAALGTLGSNCTSCHEAYRITKN